MESPQLNDYTQTLLVKNRFDKTTWITKRELMAVFSYELTMSGLGPKDPYPKFMEEFEKRLPYEFNECGMVIVHLGDMAQIIANVLEDIDDLDNYVDTIGLSLEMRIAFIRKYESEEYLKWMSLVDTYVKNTLRG